MVIKSSVFTKKIVEVDCKYGADLFHFFYWLFLVMAYFKMYCTASAYEFHLQTHHWFKYFLTENSEEATSVAIGQQKQQSHSSSLRASSKIGSTRVPRGAIIPLCWQSSCERSCSRRQRLRGKCIEWLIVLFNLALWGLSGALSNCYLTLPSAGASIKSRINKASCTVALNE